MVSLTIIHDPDGEQFDSSLAFDGDEVSAQLIAFLGVLEFVKYKVCSRLEGME